MARTTHTPTGSLVSGDVRTHNLGLIAGSLAGHGPLSRSQLSVDTGLTRGAVTALVGALIDAGVVREASIPRGPEHGPTEAGSERGPADDGRAQADGRARPTTHKGRPHTLLELSADRVALIALQIDADQAIALVTSLGGETLARVSLHHGRPMGEPERILDVAAEVLARALEKCSTLGREAVDLTVVVFAPIGGDPTIVIADTDLDWGPVDVLDGLRRRVHGMPHGRLVADATVAALAELSLLDGVGDMLYLKSNSGIGGAIIADGSLLAGANGMAGALGHIAIDHDGAPCACGQRGCLVTVAGPDRILDAAGLGAQRADDGLTAALAELVARIGTGDVPATAAWSAALPWIGRALHILAMTVDPGAIVVGGYWAMLADSIDREFRKGPLAAATPEQYRGARVIAGRLGEDAALLGAIWSARDRLLQDPLALGH